MKIFLISFAIIIGFGAGSFASYLYMQGRVTSAYEEGSIGEAVAMAELLAQKVAETEDAEALRAKMYQISNVSSVSVLSFLNDRGLKFPGTYIIKDSAEHAISLPLNTGRFL